MMEEIEKKPILKHIYLFKTLLLFVTAVVAYVFYNNQFSDLEFMLSNLQSSSLVLMIFTFLFVFFNTSLLGGENRVRKIFDHLLFFAISFFIITHSITFIQHLQYGNLESAQETFEVTYLQVILNYLVIVILTPILTLVSLVMSMRNVKVSGKQDKNKKNFPIIYFLTLLLAALGLAYTVITPLYSLY